MNIRDLKIKFIFIICLCLSTAFGLLFTGNSFAQMVGQQQSLEVTGYSFNRNTANMAMVAYGVVVARRFFDSNTPDPPAAAARFLDPSGESYFEYLQVVDGINLDYGLVGGYNFPGGVNAQFILRGTSSGSYFINFQDGQAQNGYARFNELRANTFHMEHDSPGGVTAIRGGGKFVWDIAESVLVSEGEPGDVVVISENEDITLVRSKNKFDTKVAGVISIDPNIHMGYSDDSRYKPLALAGVVLCKVSAENGAIKKGDILVCSSIPGHAMRADPEMITPGMILGRALGSLDQGEGKIYILVN